MPPSRAPLILLAGAWLLVAPLSAQPWSGPAAVEVVVTEDDGRPVEGARVAMSRSEGGVPEGPPPASTDPAGRALLRGLVEGEWYVEISHPGHMLYAAYVNLRAGKKPAVGFSSQVNTETSWEPLRVRFLRQPGGEPPPSAPAAPLDAGPAPPPPPPERRTPTVVRPEPTPPAPEPPEPAPRETPAAEGADSAASGEPPEPPEGPAAPPQPAPPPSEEPALSPAAPPARQAPEAVEGEVVAEPAEPPTPEPPVEPAPEGDAPPVEAAAPPVEPEPAPGEKEGMPSPPRHPAAPDPQPPPREPAPSPPEDVAPPVPATPPAAERKAVPPPPPAAEPAVEPRPPRPQAPPLPAVAPPEAAPPRPSTEPSPTPEAPPVPPSVRAARDGSCPECRAGEWAVAAEQRVPQRAFSSADPCGAWPAEPLAAAVALLDGARGAGLSSYVGSLAGAIWQVGDASLRHELRQALEPLADPATSCQVVAVLLPPGAEFTGYVYEAWDDLGGGGCVAHQDCAVGQARWSGEPRVERSGETTVVAGFFSNRSTRRARLGRLTVYFRPR